jgi:ligand-binding SRPBCC domain-containing protein
MRYQFKAAQSIPYPLETVFLFFADPENLPRLMPQWQKARIDKMVSVSPPPPPNLFPGSERVVAGSGSQITISIRRLPLSPIRLPWVAVIEDFRWLQGFCDVQQKGPFKYWRHCHTLSQEGTGTRLQDTVEYEIPLGIMGAVANLVFVRRQLAATFRYRQKRTLELLARHG